MCYFPSPVAKLHTAYRISLKGKYTENRKKLCPGMALSFLEILIKIPSSIMVFRSLLPKEMFCIANSQGDGPIDCNVVFYFLRRRPDRPAFRQANLMAL